MRNQSQTSSKQCESLLWYTRGRGYSRLPSYGLVQINKSSVVSGFPKQSEHFGTDSTANKPKTTEKYSTASWKDWMFLSHIYIPKGPKIPAGQRASWLWLLPRKWERHNRYTRMHCGNKRRDFLFRLVNTNNLRPLKNATLNLRFILYKANFNNGLYCFLQVFQNNILA